MCQTDQIKILMVEMKSSAVGPKVLPCKEEKKGGKEKSLLMTSVSQLTTDTGK